MFYFRIQPIKAFAVWRDSQIGTAHLGPAKITPLERSWAWDLLEGRQVLGFQNRYKTLTLDVDLTAIGLSNQARVQAAVAKLPFLLG